MSPGVEQALLYAAAAVIIATTLVVFIVQFVRMRRREHGDDRDGS